MGRAEKSGTPRWILISTGLLGLVAALFGVWKGVYEIQKAGADAARAQAEYEQHQRDVQAKAKAPVEKPAPPPQGPTPKTPPSSASGEKAVEPQQGSTVADAFKVKSVWMTASKKIVLTVTERQGEKFSATVVDGDKALREVSGIVGGGKVSWLARDVRAIRGVAGGDNFGTLGRDAVGDKIDFVARHDDGFTANFTLWLSKD